MQFRDVPNNFRVISIICAYNEADIIAPVIEKTIAQGVEVYLMDHNSTDDTVEIAKKYLNRGLIHIERFPEDCGYPVQNEKTFILKDILKRKEELMNELPAHWFLHADADEIRYSPWHELTLREGIWQAEALGYNAINQKALYFRPVDDSFQPGSDPEETIRYFEHKRWQNPHVKIIRKPSTKLDLGADGGHLLEYPGKKVFPLRFLLLHYPLRSHEHGMKKIYEERQNRYDQAALEQGWHCHYQKYQKGTPIQLGMDSPELKLFDLQEERLAILEEYSQQVLIIEGLSGRPIPKVNLNAADCLNFLNTQFPHHTHTGGELQTMMNVLKPALEQSATQQRPNFESQPPEIWQGLLQLLDFFEAQAGLTHNFPLRRTIQTFRVQCNSYLNKLPQE